MDMVSYSRPDVMQILNEKIVPVKITPETPHLFKSYAVNVTPVQLMIGNNGFERQRSSGFLGGPELMAWLLLGLGKFYFDHGLLDEALEMVDRLIQDYGESRLTPEAMFHHGFFLYKKTLDHRHLKEAYAFMEPRYPDSNWTRSARMVALYHYAPSVWEWTQKKDNINNCRFGVILTSLTDKK
jgi:hypothetical protein